MSQTPQTERITLPRETRGKRPSFFEDPALDQMMTFIIELTTEVAVLRERVDTVERLLDAKGSLTRADLEAYRPPADVEADRNAWRDAYVKRVFRMHPAR